jgi:hypothetical protein
VPRVIERRVTRKLPRKLYVVLCTLAAGIRGTEDLLRHPDWRIIGRSRSCGAASAFY